MSFDSFSEHAKRTAADVVTPSDATSATVTRVQNLVEAVQRISDAVGRVHDLAAETGDSMDGVRRAAAADPGLARAEAIAAAVDRMTTRTAAATDEIAALSATIRASSDNVAASIDAITEALQSVNGSSTAVRIAIGAQARITEAFVRWQATVPTDDGDSSASADNRGARRG